MLTKNALRGSVGLAATAVAAAVVVSGLSASTRVASHPPTPSDAEIRQILAARIDDFRQSVGIVVGIVTPEGRRIVSYGAGSKGGRAVDGDTVFEIGSMTKVFTNLVLSDMVQHGEAALDDPIAKYLPMDVRVPQRNGRSITLVDLATHTSGLPRLPGNMRPKDENNPYADYTDKNLYAFLSSFTLPRDPGSQFEYSNLGGGLLGHILARRAGISYEALVKQRITGPLGMTSTMIQLTPDLRAKLAGGHDNTLERVPNWDWLVLEGAGALHSTANDLLTFLAANLGQIKTPLATSMAGMLAVTRPSDSGLAGLGWQIRNDPSPRIIWHNGGTGGYRSWMGFDPAAHIGVVVLSNAFTAAGVDDIGGHILDPTIDLLTKADFTPKEHKQVTIDPTLLDRYIGRYELAPNFILSITKNGTRLFAQATGQSAFEVFPEGDKEFFAKIADIQITFVMDDAAKNASSIVLHQQGVDTPAKRIQ